MLCYCQSVIYWEERWPFFTLLEATVICLTTPGLFLLYAKDYFISKLLIGRPTLIDTMTKYCWVFLAESNLINFYHKGKQLHIKVTTSTWNWCGNWDFIVRRQTQCEIKTWTRRDSDRTCVLELWESLYFYNLFCLLVFLVLSFFWHPVCLEQFGTSVYVMV